MVRAVRSTDQSIPGTTTTTILWNGTDTFDTDTMHDPSSNPSRITINTAGIYLITVGLNFTGGTTGASTQLFVRADGTTVFGRQIYDTASTAISLAVIYKLTAGQYIEAQAYIGTGRNVGNDPATYFTALWLAQN
jgi:hypothetical protein